MRKQPHFWTTLFTKLGIRRKNQRTRLGSGYQRKLRFEQCEDRRMLATFNVNVAFDTEQVDLDNTVVTLREAVFRANLDGNHDTIHFALPAGEDTITLTQGELQITESLTIDAQGQDITIDANSGSRVFHANFGGSIPAKHLVFDGLVVTGGKTPTTGPLAGPGGGIYFHGAPQDSSLIIRNSVIKENTSELSGGGGVFVDFPDASQGNSTNNFELVNSMISNNRSVERNHLNEALLSSSFALF